MSSVKNILSIITDFLNEFHKRGIVKEFNLIHGNVDDEEFSDADEILSKFIQKINDASMITQPLKPHLEPVESLDRKDLVQININTTEMKRRISSFIHRKRKEVDEWNVQEFCGRSYVDEQDPSWEHQDSCARVDAVYIPRRGCKSHIKVSKVENNYGPQTLTKKIKTESENDESILSDVIEQRLQHMEYHLKLQADSSLRANVFQRLKSLEDRILYLESLSPEYTNLSSTDYSSPKKNSSEKDKVYLNWSISDLNKRMETLKEFLKKK